MTYKQQVEKHKLTFEILDLVLVLRDIVVYTVVPFKHMFAQGIIN